jgi:ATP-dependent Clp protease protease subunit
MAMPNPTSRRFEIRAANKTAEIWMYGPAGGGYYEGVTARQFADALKEAGKVDKIVMNINSPGGDVFEGMAIYSILNRQPAEKIVHVDGLAASIASVVAMVGDRIEIGANAMMMVHNPWGLVAGDAGEMRRYASLLDQVRRTMLPIYVARTGNAETKIMEWLDAETWMDADQAVERGFADLKVEAKAVAACVDRRLCRAMPAALQLSEATPGTGAAPAPAPAPGRSSPAPVSPDVVGRISPNDALRDEIRVRLAGLR